MGAQHLALECARPGQMQTMPTDYSFKRVHGARDLIPRRFVIEVDITAATSLPKHCLFWLPTSRQG